MEQRLVFFPHTLELGKGLPPALELPERPSRVWTLYEYEDENTPPELPYAPQHMRNAFLEDFMHDWTWRNGQFRYFSRVTRGRVWLLLEYRK